MTDYNNFKKSELIVLLENERSMRETAESTIEKLTLEWEQDANEIKAIKNELYLAERTILRMATDETIRQELEA